jgi:DNA-binding NarL/FixJ family response regulator
VIRVVVVENEALVREGLRRVLELDAEIDVVGEAADGEEGLDVIVRERPDVVLLDVRMPRKDGIALLHALRERGFVPPCLILTTFSDPDALLAAVRAGAKGYLLKDATPEQLFAAIRALHAGATHIQPALTNGVLSAMSALAGGAVDDSATEPLTERELEVLRLMAGGCANAEIASALDIAERTVKNHVSSILAKLYVRDRTRAVLKALERRLH